jgi:hypothetical protein
MGTPIIQNASDTAINNVTSTMQNADALPTERPCCPSTSFELSKNGSFP